MGATVSSVICQPTDPQIITGSNDQTIRLWDLAAGKSMCTLTNHKKSVRSVVAHPKINMFASASPDNIKTWRLLKESLPKIFQVIMLLLIVWLRIQMVFWCLELIM